MRGCGAQDERIRRVIAEIRAIYDNVRELIEYVGGKGGKGGDRGLSARAPDASSRLCLRPGNSPKTTKATPRPSICRLPLLLLALLLAPSPLPHPCLLLFWHRRVTL
jgi:hypothetical protein